MANSRILLITDVGDGAVGAALDTPTRVVTAMPDLDSAFAAPGEPEVVVVDLTDPGATAAACRAIRDFAALADVPILALSGSDDVEERISLLEAGVDDVIGRPFDARELEARVEALVLRFQRSRDLSGASVAPVITARDKSLSRVITVFSPKGGAGTTTVAVNVAVAIARQAPDRVAILDLDLQFGQVATHLNIPHRLSIADLAGDELARRDPGSFATYTDRHGSGVAVLAAPPTPDGAASITAAEIRQILDVAGRGHQYLVVDAGSELDDRSEAAIRAATDLVIVVTPEFPALKAVHALRELLAGEGQQAGETTFVLNEIFARDILRLRDIEDALETKIGLTIPYDALVFLKAVNEGVPVVVGAPRTAAAEQLVRLASRLSGADAASAPAAERRGRGIGALFGRG